MIVAAELRSVQIQGDISPSRVIVKTRKSAGDVSAAIMVVHVDGVSRCITADVDVLSLGMVVDRRIHGMVGGASCNARDASPQTGIHRTSLPFFSAQRRPSRPCVLAGRVDGLVRSISARSRWLAWLALFR